MKIAFVADVAFPWVKGGMEAMQYVEARELAKKHEVHFFCIRWDSMKGSFKHEGITYHAFPGWKYSKLYKKGRRSIREAALFALGMFRIFGYRFDIVEAHMFPIMHLPVLKLYCRLTGCKLLMEVAEVWDREYWQNYLGRVKGALGHAYQVYAIRGADFYISNPALEGKIGKYGIDTSRIRVFTPAIDEREINRIGPVKKEKRLVIAARLIKEKRIDKWLIIFKEVKKRVPEVKGVIIGKGPEEEALRKMRSRLKLESSVEMLRDLDREELYRIVKGSYVLIHMSEREGLSLITLESLALGTPVVLPTYTTIPNEVKRMCVVEDEKDIPRKVVEILKSRNPSSYIFEKDRLGEFSLSSANEFYEELFGKMKNGSDGTGAVKH